MTLLRRLRALGENNLALKLFALAIATLLYFAVRPGPGRRVALGAQPVTVVGAQRGDVAGPTTASASPR